MHAATSIPLADRVRLMAHLSAMRAFAAPNTVRLFQEPLPAGFPGGHEFRDGSLLVMLRPACWFGRLARPRRQLAPPTGPPVYGRACPSRGLPQPESAITTRPNHPLPRQDLHLRARQRLKAAHRSLFFAPACTQRYAGEFSSGSVN